MKITNKQGKVVRLKKSTIDLRTAGRWDWVGKSIAEANEMQEARKRAIEQESNSEWGVTHINPPFNYYPQRESVSWFQALSNIDYKRVLRTLLP